LRHGPGRGQAAPCQITHECVDAPALLLDQPPARVELALLVVEHPVEVVKARAFLDELAL
jgi:hypothetical protein